MNDVLTWDEFKTFVNAAVPPLTVRILAETAEFVRMCAVSADDLLRCDCVLKKYDTVAMAEFEADYRPSPLLTPYITKGLLWELLEDRALPFAVWLTGTSATQLAVKAMWDSMGDTLNLDSPVIAMQMIPLLQSEGVLDAPAISRIDAYKAQFA